MDFKRAIFLLLILFIGTEEKSFSQNLKINPELTVADLLDKDGNLYLFRYISQNYIPGRLGIVSQHTGLISYTINPLIFLNGTAFGYEKTAPHILLAKHSMGDNLFYVDKNHQGLGKNPLRLETKIKDFNSLTFEVEVPIKKENVISVIPLEDFQKKLAFMGDININADYRNLVFKVLTKNDCETSFSKLLPEF